MDSTPIVDPTPYRLDRFWSLRPAVVRGRELMTRIATSWGRSAIFCRLQMAIIYPTDTDGELD